ncbi:MAG: transcriptional repressor NrdR [Proteobacteria bacterium]|nr:transcriptional repressor NrdR [Pseudomonadota bacterium]
MKCPFCPRQDSKVIDSRLSKDGLIIRRRRECEGCGKRFTTYERVEEPLPAVAKKDGRREAFDRAKIASGIKKACEKRPVSTETIDAVVDRIERWALELGEAEIKSQDIGARVMSELHDLDEVAYVRFASVYRSFKDISEFMHELSDLLGRNNTAK